MIDKEIFRLFLDEIRKQGCVLIVLTGEEFTGTHWDDIKKDEIPLKSHFHDLMKPGLKKEYDLGYRTTSKKTKVRNKKHVRPKKQR